MVAPRPSRRSAFTLIELLVVIAIIAILAVVVVLTLNPAQLLAQSRDANRVSDMATLNSALNLYATDQTGASSFSLGTTTNTYISLADSSSTCGDLGMMSLGSSTWACSPSSQYRNASSSGWLPVNLNQISSGSPLGSLPVDPVNQTSSGLFYAYNTNGSQFEVTAILESQKYKQQYGTNVQTNLFPEVISAGTPTVSALYNPTGLIGYWPLSEGSGSVAQDQSGNGNNGAWQGTAAYTAGKVGAYAGSFNGTNAWINIPYSSILNTNAVTITAWIQKPVSTSYLGIVGRGDNKAYNLYLNSGGDTLRFDLASGGITQYAMGGSLSIGNGAWAFVAATYDGVSKAMLCVNNTCQTNGALGAYNLSATSSLMIGNEGYGGRYWNGYIDDVRVYNRALSQAEVMAIYNAER